jgi:soluble lytic murein transglycosylase-like protein
MKKHLMNYIQSIDARIRTGRQQLSQNEMELNNSHLVGGSVSAIGSKVFNVISIASVFLVIALMVNQPLRAELTKSLVGDDAASTELSEQEAQPEMKKVSLAAPSLTPQSQNAFKTNNVFDSANNNVFSPNDVVEPGAPMPIEVIKAPVPSIAPLANRISDSQIDPQAFDSKLLEQAADQRRVADFMANKYRTDPARVRQYIAHTMQVAKEVNLDPVLLIAVMAIESNFNPNAQSGAGAQGLMQVMTKVHLNKYAPYGGAAAAFKPEANIRVGAYILKYYIAQAGSLTGGLRYYVGGPAVSADGGYVGKVLRERDLLIGFLQKGDGSTTAAVKSKSATDADI